MPHHVSAALTSGRAAMLLGAALRDIDRGIPDPVDLDAFRKALETELEKEPIPFVALITVGRRWAPDRIRGLANQSAAKAAVYYLPDQARNLQLQ